MKLLLLSNGKSIHTTRWANGLSSAGVEVHLVFKYDDEPVPSTLDQKVFQYRLRFGGKKGYYLNAIGLNKLFKKISPDVVNAHYASGYGTLARLAKLKPLVLSVWGSDVYDFPYINFFNYFVLKRNLYYSNVICSTSYSMMEQVKKLLNGKQIPIEVTPFGVDTNKFDPKLKSITKKAKIIKIGVIKTLASKYGIDDFIYAIEILLNKLRRDYKYFLDQYELLIEIYGDGPQKDYLVNIIKNLNLKKVVFLKGIISHDMVANVLGTFDIFCGTSIIDSESFGVSVVEAMAMEIPVVVTDVSGYKEVVEHDMTGLIVKRKNPQSIATGLLTLLLNKSMMHELGINGRKRVLKLYDWHKNVRQMIDVYKSLLK
jgi:glycosyltransferase involved in cell wall biosynthesis